MSSRDRGGVSVWNGIRVVRHWDACRRGRARREWGWDGVESGAMTPKVGGGLIWADLGLGGEAGVWANGGWTPGLGAMVQVFPHKHHRLIAVLFLHGGVEFIPGKGCRRREEGRVSGLPEHIGLRATIGVWVWASIRSNRQRTRKPAKQANPNAMSAVCPSGQTPTMGGTYPYPCI